MHALIIVAHPDTSSFTHSVAKRIAEGIVAAEGDNSFEIADLVAEGFDPTFSPEDYAGYRNKAPKPAAVIAEQQRVERADALVFVYPVYWWSMPAIMKGWLERILTVGWAVEYVGENFERVKQMGRYKIHLVAVAGADASSFATQAYVEAHRTIVEIGIFDYCGAKVVTSDLLLGVDLYDPTPHLETAFRIGHTVGSSQ